MCRWTSSFWSICREVKVLRATPHQQVFRPHMLLRLTLVVLCAFPVWAVWSEGGPSGKAQLLIALVVTAAAIVVAVRAIRAAVVVGPEEVRVQGVFRDVHLRRRQITAVDERRTQIHWQDDTSRDRSTMLPLFRTDAGGGLPWVNAYHEAQIAAL